MRFTNSHPLSAFLNVLLLVLLEAFQSPIQVLSQEIFKHNVCMDTCISYYQGRNFGQECAGGIYFSTCFCKSSRVEVELRQYLDCIERDCSIQVVNQYTTRMREYCGEDTVEKVQKLGEDSEASGKVFETTTQSSLPTSISAESTKSAATIGPTQSNGPTEDNSQSTGAKIGAAVGASISFLIILAVVLFFTRRSLHKRASPNHPADSKKHPAGKRNTPSPFRWHELEANTPPPENISALQAMNAKLALADKKSKANERSKDIVIETAPNAVIVSPMSTAQGRYGGYDQVYYPYTPYDPPASAGISLKGQHKPLPTPPAEQIEKRKAYSGVQGQFRFHEGSFAGSNFDLESSRSVGTSVMGSMRSGPINSTTADLTYLLNNSGSNLARSETIKTASTDSTDLNTLLQQSLRVDEELKRLEEEQNRIREWRSTLTGLTRIRDLKRQLKSEERMLKQSLANQCFLGASDSPGNVLRKESG